MAKPRLDLETKTLIVARNAAGESMDALADEYGVSKPSVRNWVVYGPAGRLQKPTEVTLEQVIETYERLGGIHEAAHELKTHVTRARKILDDAGYKRKDTGRERLIAPKDIRCRICDKEIMARQMFYTPDSVVPPRTCGDPACKAQLAMGGNPPPPIPRADLRNRVYSGWTPAAKESYMQREANSAEIEEKMLLERLEVDLLELAEHLLVAELGEFDAKFELVTDARGKRRPGSQQSVWGDLSRVPVYMRLVSRRDGDTAITLVLEGDETAFDRFIEKFFPAQDRVVEISKSFRPLLAWRCACPAQTLWTLDSLVDLPEEEGPHGTCGRCGAAALYIVKDD
jgi:hypothetical protein